MLAGTTCAENQQIARYLADVRLGPIKGAARLTLC